MGVEVALFCLGLLVVFCFSFVLLFGAPFLPTLPTQVNAALDLLDLKPEQLMIDLGCGDGRVLIAAARRGWRVVGYELNPLLALLAWLRCRPYQDRVVVVWADYWRAQWPQADGIFAFILPRYMAKLHTKVIQSTKHAVKVASFGFKIPDKQPTRLDQGIFLYDYRV